MNSRGLSFDPPIIHNIIPSRLYFLQETPPPSPNSINQPFLRLISYLVQSFKNKQTYNRVINTPIADEVSTHTPALLKPVSNTSDDGYSAGSLKKWDSYNYIDHLLLTITRLIVPVHRILAIGRHVYKVPMHINKANPKIIHVALTTHLLPNTSQVSKDSVYLINYHSQVKARILYSFS